MKTLITFFFCLTALNLPAQTPPNIIIMLMDDMGVNDVGVYTYPSKQNPGPPPAVAPTTDSNVPPPNSAYDANAAGLSITPHIDGLAADGVRFTRFYATHSVCTPTRASLMTGCYATRVRLETVVGPYGDGPTGLDATGLNSTERTLPELLREKGYATGMSGKWHLGHRLDFNPTRHGFERFFGILYSHDMWTNNPYSSVNWGNLNLMENETALGSYTTDTGRTINGPISTDTEQSYLLEAMTDEAVDFIDQSVAASRPFFLYFAPHTSHVPIHPHPDFLSVAGQTDDVARYYDQIRENDARVGEILARLETHGIANNTIVIFTSDNGPWQDRPGSGNLEQGTGSAYPFRGGKNTTYEGGHRVPLLARFPGRIPAGSIRDELGVTFDLFTTLALQAGATLPTDRVIDGQDIWPLLTGSASAEIHDAFYYYDAGGTNAEGVLDLTAADRWKLVSGSTSPAHNGLFRLGDAFTGDFQELSNVSGANSSINSALSTQLGNWNSQMTRRTKGLAQTVSIELENDAVTVNELGTASTRIRLSAAANATVNVARFSGDGDLSVVGGASLTFTTSNWNVWQTVTFAFPGDSDLVSQSATFRASSGSLHVREIFVFENDTGSFVPPANPPPDNLLRLHYRFDETSGSTAADASASANNGTVVGTSAWAAGKVGNAIDLSAASLGYVTSGSGINGNNTTGLSAAAWVRLDAAATTENRWILQQLDGTGPGRTWLAVQSDGKLYSYVGGLVSSGGSISLGVWHHVAITAGSGTVTLYVDGLPVSSVPATVEADNAAFRIGNHKTLDIAKQWDGLIDELRIYDGVLTSDEVLYLASSDAEAPTITALANQTIPQDTTAGPLAFTIGDDVTLPENLMVAKSSSNTALLPVSGITLGGSGANREITLTPAAGQSGSSLVTLTVTDEDGRTGATSFTLTVTAVPVATAIVVTPAAPAMPPGGTLQFSAVLKDQFGQPFSPQPSFTWSVSGGGSINAAGLFTAGTALGTFTVTATAGALNGSTDVTVQTGPTVFSAFFNNGTGSGGDDDASAYGWTAAVGAGGILDATLDNTADNAQVGVSQGVTSAQNVPVLLDQSTSAGFLFVVPDAAAGVSLLHTTHLVTSASLQDNPQTDWHRDGIASLEGLKVGDITGLSVYTRPATSATTMRFAIQAGGQWLVSTTAFNQSNTGVYEPRTLSNLTAANTWYSGAFTPDAALDADLTDNPTVTLNAGDLVTGYGWYADTHGQISSDSRVRIDSYQVTADFPPPPASGYAAWSDSAFPAEATPAEREPAFDFDNDGLSNLLEYGLGSDPAAASTAPAAQVVEITGQKYLQIQWTRPDDRTDITTLGEISNDLTPLSWSSAPADVLTTITPAGAGLETVTIRDAEPLDSNTRRFLHARILLNAM